MDKVKSYIEKNKDRFLNELFELLRIPSISAQSDHKPDMTRCAEWLAASLMKAGADHAEVLPTEGNPVVFAERIVDPKAKTVLVYGHYDAMPVDPVDEWRTSPFEPVVKDGRIWCRGADDDKGQLFMHAKAFEAMCATDSLPCNVKFLLEGEEEIGSPSLYKFCADNKKMLWIPEGFAHGFVVLSDVAEFCYKCTDVYDPTAEGGIPYDDPTVNVQWPDCGCEHKTSAKDKEHTPFAAQKFEYFEKY